VGRIEFERVCMVACGGGRDEANEFEILEGGFFLGKRCGWGLHGLGVFGGVVGNFFSVVGYGGVCEIVVGVVFFGTKALGVAFVFWSVGGCVWRLVYVGEGGLVCICIVVGGGFCWGGGFCGSFVLS